MLVKYNILAESVCCQKGAVSKICGTTGLWAMLAPVSIRVTHTVIQQLERRVVGIWELHGDTFSGQKPFFVGKYLHNWTQKLWRIFIIIQHSRNKSSLKFLFKFHKIIFNDNLGRLRCHGALYRELYLLWADYHWYKWDGQNNKNSCGCKTIRFIMLYDDWKPNVLLNVQANNRVNDHCAAW